MIYILATKEYMTQFFGEDGKVHPATLLSAGPVVVTQVKDKEKDGYDAVQVGFMSKKKLTKPLKGHFKTLGDFRYVREFRTAGGEGTPKTGDRIDVSIFKKGDVVIVSGINKGKGFSGVVKRHGFHGGPRTHGQKHSEREPGSIGGGGRAGGKVIKGMRMAGRMGGVRTTVRNLQVLDVDEKSGRLLVSGATPGRRGTLLEVRGK